MIYIFTSAAWNYLPKAQILAKSVRKYLPDSRMILALPDKMTDDVDARRYDFDEVIPVSRELCSVENFNAWVFSHDIVELATAIKPFVLCELLERPDCEAVLYFDPDVELFSPLPDLLEKFKTRSILLTPHQALPESDEANVIGIELCSLQHGVYNFGFFGVKNSPIGHEYANWWRARCKRFCYSDIPNGIFTDQRWNDLVPAFFPEVEVLRESRFNVAVWNTTRRKMARRDDGQWMVDDKPLGFYHFTGIDSGAHYRMIGQYSCSPKAQTVFVKCYEAKMRKAANDPLCQRPWAYLAYKQGGAIMRKMRTYVREDSNMGKLFRDPFDRNEKPRSFYDWYQQNVACDQDKLCGSETERFQQLLRINERIRRENREMQNSKSWRITQPLRSMMLKVRESRWYFLARKFKESLRKYGINLTLRKVFVYVVVNGGRSRYEKHLLKIEDAKKNQDIVKVQHFVLTEELLSRVICEPNVEGKPCKVSVIIPVYNGLKHLERLVPGLLANTPESVPLQFIDDASSDEKVRKFLDELSDQYRNRVCVVRHHINYGFVKSVNDGLKRTSGDVIILNSDTQVPSHWVERLYSARTPNTGSVTPFSNAAALLSFPSREGNNRDLIMSVPCERIDQAFHGLNIKPELRHAPSGVGFCMLMMRKAIDKVGLFDEKAFGKGYGEEVDWCVRAFNHGFDNVIASDLFVAHYDGGSFTEQQKGMEAREHEKIFSLKHPDFHGRHYLRHFEKIEPYWELVRNMAALRLFTQPEFKPLIVIGNHLTGGSADFLLRYDQQIKRSIIYLRPLDHRLSIEVRYHEVQVVFEAENLELLFSRNLIISATDIFVNHFLKWELYFGDVYFSSSTYYKFVNLLVDLKERTGAKVHFMFHDFFSVCPSYTLLNANDNFCFPDACTRKCKGCVARLNLDLGIFSVADIDAWRKEASRFFAACDEIRFFSDNTKSIVTKIFRLQAKQMTVVPHEPLVKFKPQVFPLGKSLVIGVVGGINKCKGADFLGDFALYLKQRNPCARIAIIGEVDHPPYPDNVIVHGRYNRSELPVLLKKYNVNVGFIASIWPETFSYVTQELMMLDLPLVCFDLGAPRDRIMKYKKGAIIKSISCQCAYEAIEKLMQELKILKS